jgi:hypothetical protein
VLGSAVIEAAPVLAIAAKLAYHYFNGGKKEVAPIVRLARAQMDETSTPFRAVRSAIIPPRYLGGEYSDYGQRLFHGMIKSPESLRSVMKAYGGNGELQIVAQEVANTHFKRAGGGRFSPGLYVPHPKDPSVLVPTDSYAEEMKDEVLAELYEMFALLGAKRIVVGDKTEAKLKGTFENLNPAGSVKVQMEARYGHEHVFVQEFHRSTPNIEMALKNRLWLGDDRKMAAVVKNLERTAPKSVKETITKTIALSGAVEVLALAAPSINSGSAGVSYERSWALHAEFYDRA